MSDWELEVFSPTGQTMKLIGGTSGVSVAKGGMIPTHAVRQAETFQPVGVGPARLVKGRAKVGESSGSLTVNVRPAEGRTALENWHRFVSMFEPDDYSTLVLTSPNQRVFRTRVRLAAEGVPEPEITAPVFLALGLPLVRDNSMWSLVTTQDGPTVAVTNTGKTPLFPSIKWTTGGTVTLPSGATFTLPTVPVARTVTLNHNLFFDVTDHAGKRDVNLWRQINAQVLGEMVPIGATRTFTIPSGAKLITETEVNKPW